ncbi:DNA-binding protein with cold shock-like domain [Leptolyngbya sp. PCC 7375]|nr:DNA-binding protein with cold shock-like domain [Leptolyngbya sp. PCC 7375]
MGRRLIRIFLHWLRRILTQFKGEQNRRHYPSPPQRLTSSQQLLPQIPVQENQPEQGLTGTTSPIKQQRQAQSPNPAANRAANSSNFRILLSDYQYSPCSAVQSLSNQLSNPTTQLDRVQDQPKQTLDSAKTFFTQNKIRRDQPQPRVVSTETPKEESLPHEHIRNLEHSSSDIAFLRDPDIDINKTQPSPSLLAIDAVKQLNTKQLPQPEKATPKYTSTPTADPRAITKTGIIKLLFKLKKNNHHGYIAPHDGSSDIIFHQKYIGNEVFCQLERGMDVEVTAHITEGKAYADHIRIL